MTKQTETRTCRLCNEVKPLELFERDSRVRSGRTHRCRECKYTLDDRASRTFRGLKRRAQEDGIPLEVTRKELQALYMAFDGECIYCGTKEDENGRAHHIDHVIPVSDGGRHHISNLVLSCPSDNSSKGNKPLIAFFFEKRGDQFTDERFVKLVHYLALVNGQPVEEITRDFTQRYAEYVMEEFSRWCDKAAERLAVS
ncbi:HNH endonuclease signature motif containing protein [Siminovitchia sp. 179-K 8D1 HS]